MRPREASNAISQSVIAAIRSIPFRTARFIAFRAPVESSGPPATSQSQMWVSSRNSCRSEVVGITGPFDVLNRTDNVTANLDGPGHTAEEVYAFVFHRHKLGDRFSPFGDDDRPPLSRDIVHQSQTIRLEIRRSNVPIFVHIA
jgi:hypothetical protein